MGPGQTRALLGGLKKLHGALMPAGAGSVSSYHLPIHSRARRSSHDWPAACSGGKGRLTKRFQYCL
jgi:hypothetical protein